MPQVCSICNHEARHKIDTALVSGSVSLRDIAGQYRVSRSALSRHVAGGHIEKKLQLAQKAFDTIAADKFIQWTEKRHKRFDEMVQIAQRLGDIDMELRIYREWSRISELECKANGTFREKREHSGNLTLRFDKEDEAT